MIKCGFIKANLLKGICLYPRGKLSSNLNQCRGFFFPPLQNFIDGNSHICVVPLYSWCSLCMRVTVCVCERHKGRRRERSNTDSAHRLHRMWFSPLEQRCVKSKVEITLACDSDQKLSQSRLRFRQREFSLTKSRLPFWCLKRLGMRHFPKTEQLGIGMLFFIPCQGVKSHAEFKRSRVERCRWWPLN